ncbi:hypothetical protein [Maritalea sp.]|uniref:hypothetical protein n=1 Tax=Maritalea sp. TaxID=2003361 RepID=UPI003EF4886A
MIDELSAEGMDNQAMSDEAALPNSDISTDNQNQTEPSNGSHGLKIFRATRQEEILKIKDISLEFHGESRYAHLAFSEEKFIRAFTKAIRNPHDTLAIYVQYRGETVAVLNAGAGDYYLGVGGRMVTIYVMYVSAKVRHTLLGGKVGVKLLRIVSDWAKSQHAKEIHIHSTSGIEPERTDKLLTRMGFKVIGGNYVVGV